MSEHDDVHALRRRLAEAEALLAERTRELGALSLQRDVLAMTDPVTGLLNRGGIIDALELALVRLDRTAEPFALIGVRVEGARDAETVRHVGALLMAGLRALDRVGRWDDETFCVVAPLLGAADPEAPADRVRRLFDIPVAPGVGVPRIAVVLPEPGPNLNAEAFLDALRRALDRADGGEPVIVRA